MKTRSRWIACGLLLLALLCAAPLAWAGHYDLVVSPCTGTYTQKVCASKSEADANVYFTDNQTHSSYSCGSGTYRQWQAGPWDIPNRRVYRSWKCPTDSTWNTDTAAWATWPATCGSGETYNTTTGACDNNACATATPFTGSVTMPSSTYTSSDNQFCKGGCTFYAAGGTQVGNTFTGKFYPYPSGQTCTSGDPRQATPANSSEQCTPMGNLSSCYNSDTGQICAVTPRGNKACWSPSDNSTKASPDQGEALAKSTAPTVPAAPPGLNNAETGGVQHTTSSGPSSTTINNYNITYSNQTGVPGTGTQGSTSSGTSTGTNPSSSGSGSGSGTGTGACPAGTDCTGAGSAGAGLGTSSELYGGLGGKTYASVMSAHLAAVQETPIVSAVSGFFQVNATSAACPALNLPHWEFLGHSSTDFSFTWHCSGPFHSVLVGVGVFLMIGAAWAAFRWAFGET